MMSVEHHDTDCFTLKLSGQDIYDLIALLEQFAVKDDCYLRVEQCVKFAELLRDSASQDGWGAGPAGPRPRRRDRSALSGTSCR